MNSLRGEDSDAVSTTHNWSGCASAFVVNISWIAPRKADQWRSAVGSGLVAIGNCDGQNWSSKVKRALSVRGRSGAPEDEESRKLPMTSSEHFRD